MVKYHLGVNGPALCKADKKPCPIKGEHFDNLKDCQRFYESSRSESMLPKSTRKQSVKSLNSKPRKSFSVLKDVTPESLKAAVSAARRCEIEIVNEDGDFEVEAPEGYRLLGTGSYRFALRDEKSGVVYKFLASDFVGSKTQKSVARESHLREAGALSRLSETDLSTHSARYAETEYYTVGSVNVMAQEFVEKTGFPVSEGGLRKLSQASPELWDVRPENLGVDKGGFIVLFDCLRRG